MRARKKCTAVDVVVKGGVEDDERWAVQECEMREKRSIQ